MVSATVHKPNLQGGEVGIRQIFLDIYIFETELFKNINVHKNLLQLLTSTFIFFPIFSCVWGVIALNSSCSFFQINSLQFI